MRIPRNPVWVGLLLASAGPLPAQDKYAGPDVPAAHAAARRALPGTVRPIVKRIVGIAGMGSSVAGTARGIEATLEALDATVTAQEIRIDLAADVLFDFDRAEIKPAAAEDLGKVAQVLREHPGAPVTIEGHTDGKGADDYNLQLSRRRAEAVKAWLVTNAGIPASSVSTRGLGESKPVASNTRPDGSDDPDGRQRNRRVEIIVRRTGA